MFYTEMSLFLIFFTRKQHTQVQKTCEIHQNIVLSQLSFNGVLGNVQPLALGKGSSDL